MLASNIQGLNTDELEKSLPAWRSPMKALLEKNIVRKTQQEVESKLLSESSIDFTLNTEQQVAYEEICKQLNEFHCWLIDGVTGSGKTEVYLSLAKDVLADDKQILFLVPEIGLTPQLVERVEQRLATKVHLMHSGLNDNQRGTDLVSVKNR